MNDAAQEVSELPALLDVLTMAVTTLDAAGMDRCSDVYLYIAGYRGGQRVSDLTVECGQLSLTPARVFRAGRLAAQPADMANRRALLIAQFCYLSWHWQWEVQEAADYLGCSTQILDNWIAAAARSDVPNPPTFVVARMRRAIALEYQRQLIGVDDDDVADWLRARRKAFGGRSVLELLSMEGETGFRRVNLWLLNAMPASRTLH